MKRPNHQHKFGSGGRRPGQSPTCLLSRGVGQTCDMMPPNAPRRLISLFKPFSRVDGNCSNRSVCPVGAVSNMMQL